MTMPLDGVRVLDLTTGPAGGIATMILADFGADVTKLDPPDGDPFAAHAAAPMWSRGKRRTTLNLKTEAGVATLHDLVPTADVVVTAWRPGVAERLRSDYATLASLNPRLVYCSITGFGPRGPYSQYKGYEGLVAAKSGRMMTFEGQIPRPGPQYAAVQVGAHAASQAAVHGILSALIVRGQTGRGQLVQTSLLQGMLPYDLAGLVMRQVMRRFPEQFPIDPYAARMAQPTLQYQPVLTKDGHWLQLGNLMEHLFHSYIAAAGLSDIYGDPRFTDAPRLSDEDREALRLIMLERMREKTLDEWMAIFMADGNVAAEPIVSTQQGLTHPQAIDNGTVVDVDHPDLGPMKQIGLVAKLTKTPGRVGGRESSPSPVEPFPNPQPPIPNPRSLAPGPRPPRHPLEGVTVVEFATIIAAPYACSILADLGARVIKVEATEGDGLRNLGGGVSTVKTTAGKESICVDLKSEAGRAIARRLVERADILIHNYRPGVPERLGIGYDEVACYNPAIVYISATGYGSDGPHARRPAAHPVAGAAMGGVLWQAGSGMPPAGQDDIYEIRETARSFMRANELNPDPNTSVVIATSALLGLYVQRMRGIGQHIQANMITGNAYANFDDFLSYEGKPDRPLVDPELHGLNALYRLYPTAEGWVFLACPMESEWRALCRALDRPDLLDDARFHTPAGRREHDAELASVLGGIFCSRTANAWEETLSRHDVGCVRADAGPVAWFWDTDEHAYRNGFVREAEHLKWGPYWRHGPLVTFSDTPERCGAGVLAGQHTVQLLREVGYTPDEITALQAAGVVRSEAP